MTSYSTHWGQGMDRMKSSLKWVITGQGDGVSSIGAKPSPKLCRFIVIWNMANQQQWNINQTTNTFYEKNVFRIIICKIAAILFRP